jgi:multidrug efflux pump subunit AcrA (membrane-fusion protein)
MLPGAFVHARIDGRRYEQEKVFLIPRECVVDGSVYMVDADDIVRQRTVQLGRRLQSLVMVTDGIDSGDRLVLTNLDIVEDGTEVSVHSSTTALDEIESSQITVIRSLASDSQ